MPHVDRIVANRYQSARRKLNPDVHRNCDFRYKRTIKGRFARLKAAAKVRDIEVHITLDEYTRIFTGICFYCESIVESQSGHCLDRKDSKFGYSVDNVVVCCKNCNRIKSDLLTLEETKVVIAALKEYRARMNRL